MKKIKVYIASPYTLGDVGENVKVQIDAADYLMDNGFAPYTPLLAHFQHIVHPRHYDDWLELCLEWLPMCDCIIRLPGESKGADIEVGIAKEKGIPVFYSLDEVCLFYGITETSGIS